MSSTEQAFARITNQATKEAMEAKQQYQTDAQRRRVEALREQVDDRLGDLANRVQRVKWDSVKFPHGAFGRDAESLDDLLRALAAEQESLDDMEAASAAAERLTEKFQNLVEQSEVEVDRPNGEPISMGAGQYL